MSMIYAEPEWEAANEFFRDCEGLFVGQLTPGQLATFQRAVEQGYARRSYEGGAGWLGLAKVRRC